MKKLLTIFAALVALSLSFIPQARAESSFITSSDQHETTSIREPTNNDVFLTGNDVRISAPVAGEVFAAGNVITITKQSGRSIYVAGNVVNLDQGSRYNSFVAGNTVTLSGTYGHDVYVSGNAVTITEGTVINGDLRIGGSTVSIAGTIKGNVYASGGQISSSADVGGNFSGKAGTYAFTGGSIAGDLTYQSKEQATGLEKVTVTGKTAHTDLPEAAKTPPHVRVIGWLVSILATLVLGATLIVLMPKKVGAQLGALTEGWTGLAATGLVFLIVAPVAALLAFVTMIGWKVGLVILALYIIHLLCSNVVAAIVFGKLILNYFKKNGSPWLHLLIGIAVVSLLGAIPWFGWIVSITFFFGLVLPCLGSLAKGTHNTLTTA